MNDTTIPRTCALAEAVRDVIARHGAGLGSADSLRLRIAANELDSRLAELSRVRGIVLTIIAEDSVATIDAKLGELHAWALNEPSR